MRRITVAVFTMALVLSLFAGASARAEVDFVINVLPGSLLINAEDPFVTTQPDGQRLSLSSVYLMPNISAGLGLELGKFFVDVTAGAGVVVNESFRSFMFQAQIAALYNVTDALEIGPHFGYINFPNPEWLEDADMELDGTDGWIVGLEIGMGDRLMYLVSVDLIMADFEVDDSKSTTSTDSGELSLMALAVQFGIRGEF